MSVDQITDEEFFKLYKGNNDVREIVDGIQMKHHVHHSQKGKPGYNESNIATATREAKETVSKLIKPHGNSETGHGSSNHENHSSPGFSLPQLTHTQYGVGLAATVGLLFILVSGGAAAPLAAMGYKSAASYAATAYVL